VDSIESFCSCLFSSKSGSCLLKSCPLFLDEISWRRCGRTDVAITSIRRTCPPFRFLLDGCPGASSLVHLFILFGRFPAGVAPCLLLPVGFALDRFRRCSKEPPAGLTPTPSPKRVDYYLFQSLI